jgi:hypothetical protein
MISIYLDWNVIAQIKNGLNPELKDVLDTNRFLIPFSTSHIGDIFSSFSDNLKQLEQINSDLEFISSLSKNYCLSNDGMEVRLHVNDPKDLFQQRVDEKDLLRNLSLDTLSRIMESNEQTKDIGKKAIDILKKLPLDKAFADALTNPESSEQMGILFPGLKDDPTMEGFFKCFLEMITRMNETEDYKQLRKITQTGLGINRDKIYNSDDPYRIIDKAYENFKIDPKEIIPDSKYAPVWFDAISNEYLKLDMHGYQEDKVKTTKGRKETFRNTTEDAFHAAFASICNFYITNDNKSFEKTKKVYEQIGIDTLVFRPNEFVEYYKTFLSERATDLELQIPIRLLETGNYSEKQVENGLIRTYHVPYFTFDFFNKMIVIMDKSDQVTMIVLSQFFPTNKGITYFFEIERLSPKLYQALGNDSSNQGQIKRDELEKDEWSGRKWNFKDLSIRFIRINGHYQLCCDFPVENDENK